MKANVFHLAVPTIFWLPLSTPIRCGAGSRQPDGDRQHGCRYSADQNLFAEEHELAPTLAAYAEKLQALPRLEKQLENAISEKGEIKDSASNKLGGLRTGIQIAKNRVREQLEKILHDANNQKYFQDALVTMRGDRYVIPIKQEYKLNFPGVVHDSRAAVQRCLLSRWPL